LGHPAPRPHGTACLPRGNLVRSLSARSPCR
jgi:hypothetical protein